MRTVDYIHELPDVYRKDSASNNYKLLLLDSELVAALRDDIDAVQETLDIYTATGKTLDLYGAIYGVSRGTATDEQYRYLITQAVAQNMVEGDYNSIVNAISAAFDVPTSEFAFKETSNPAEVEVTNLPYSIILSAGLTVDQVRDIIKGLLPTGVTLVLEELSGTFEFGTSEDEYDELKGFGNVDQTIGGYFGYLVSK